MCPHVEAFFILLLLGGHEAVRIHEDVNLTALTYQNEDPMWEKVYRDMNKAEGGVIQTTKTVASLCCSLGLG